MKKNAVIAAVSGGWLYTAKMHQMYPIPNLPQPKFSLRDQALQGYLASRKNRLLMNLFKPKANVMNTIYINQLE